MTQTILIKFCGFIVHLKPNNMAIYSGKIPEIRKIFALILCVAVVQQSA